MVYFRAYAPQDYYYDRTNVNAYSPHVQSVGDSGRERLTSTNLYKYVNHFASDPLLSTLHNLNLSQVSADDDTDAEN